jgi:hypothetical protein
MGGFDVVAASDRSTYALERLEPRRLFSTAIPLIEFNSDPVPYPYDLYEPTLYVPSGEVIIVDPGPPEPGPGETPGDLPGLYPYTHLVEAGGGRLVGGAASADTRSAFVFCLRPDGSFDPGFGGGDGIVKIAGSGMLNQIVVQDDGKILLLTGGWDDGVAHLIYRLNADGSADRTFADAGLLRLPRAWNGESWPMIAVRPGGGFVVANAVTDWDAYRFIDDDPPSTLVLRSYTGPGRRDLSFGDAGELRVESAVTLGDVEALGVSDAGVIDLTLWYWYDDASATLRYDPADASADAPALRAVDSDVDYFSPVTVRGPDGRTAIAVEPGGFFLDSDEAKAWPAYAGTVAVGVFGPHGALDDSFGDHGRLKLPQAPGSQAGETQVFFTADGGLVEWHLDEVSNYPRADYGGTRAGYDPPLPVSFSITRITPDGRLDTAFGGGDGQVVLKLQVGNNDIRDEADWHINLPTDGPEADPETPADDRDEDVTDGDSEAVISPPEEEDESFDSDDADFADGSDVYDEDEDDDYGFGADQDELWDE